MTKKTRKRRKGRKWNKSLLIPICLLGISVLLMAASIYMEGFANWYTEHIYPIVSGAMGRIFGMIPVSVAEIGLYLLVLILVFGLIYIVLSVFHRAWTRQRSKKTAKVLLWIVSLLLFLYVVNCGINYRSASFSEKSGIQTRKYTVEELAEELGLLPLLERRTDRLSAGEKQKTALARALSFWPRLLLLDEPSANLDRETTAEIERILLKMKRERGTTIIIVTHDLEQAGRLADNVIFLDMGQIRALENLHRK